MKYLPKDGDVMLIQINCDAQEETISQFKSTISELEKLCEDLKAEKQTLLTRLSQISAMKFIDGNPNITDLSDPNRPDKLAEQFSELYDNQWTDSFQVLCERLSLSDEDAIKVLLKIMMTVYDLCRQQVEYQNKKLGKALRTFTGVETYFPKYCVHRREEIAILQYVVITVQMAKISSEGEYELTLGESL
ncbi:hypothetical protein CHS0354_035514 [Potamilus streckersoni]|uniref:Uncharacterized protein n=1 Tax=Potamilus streckersoni TaxID=2493646 RepID=A0AAE0VKW7_9BIVA|nr:hypothetical protein CHS0354_035514 [Potamilus streckersoni]